MTELDDELLSRFDKTITIIDFVIDKVKACIG